MNLMTQIASMVIGFVTVMLATSLVVSVLVRVVHYLGDKRSQTLGEMLGALNRAFRANAGDHVLSGDRPQTTFVLDVLSYPTLHLSSDLNAVTTKGTRYLDVQGQRKALASRVEYLTEENLIEIVTRLSLADSKAVEDPKDVAPKDVLPKVDRIEDVQTKDGKTKDVALPARWFDRIEPRRATLGELTSYIRTWYKTVEDVGTQNFVLASRHLTAVLSCIVVVFLCLDGIELGVDLYRAPAALTDHLADQGSTLLHSPTQAEAIHPSGQNAAERDPDLKDLESSLIQNNSLLNEPGLNLGWQNSWLVKELARVRRNEPGAPTRGALVLDVLRWLVGLGTSCLLVSLGAPFWADQLSALLNLRNATAPPKKKSKPTKEEAEAA
jgi:hypothetical protein